MTASPRCSITARRAPPLRRPLRLQVVERDGAPASASCDVVGVHDDNDTDSHSLLGSRRCFRESFSLAGVVLAAPLAAGCGASAGGREPSAGRRRLLPRRLTPPSRSRRHDRGANLTPAGAEPHDLELTPGDVATCRPRRSCCIWATASCPGSRRQWSDAMAARSISSPAAPEAGSEEVRPRDPHVWLDPVRYAAMAGRSPPRSAKARAAGGWLAGSTRSTRVPARPRTLRAAPDRDESRCFRLSRRALRPRADPARRARARGGAFGPEHRAARRGGPPLGRDDRVLRDARFTEARRDGGPRGGRRDGRARPARGADRRRVAAGADYFTVMRANLAALRKALGCRPESRWSSSTASRSATGRAFTFWRTSRSRSRAASSSRSPARTAVARRPYCDSCSGSNVRRPAPCASSGRRARVVRAAPGSATCRSGRT